MGRGGQRTIVTGTTTPRQAACVSGTADPADSTPWTWDEVRRHCTPGDAWVVIRGKVYDVTKYDHPGGNVIFSHAGQDATDMFTAFHSPVAFQQLTKCCVGTLATSPQPGAGTREAIEADFRRLRAAVKDMGAFRASAAYYVWKVSSNLLIAVASVGVLALSTSWPAITLSAFLLALFYQQSGWLAHDFVHHQVFANRFLGDLMGIMLGNVWQGFSLSWWKNKHNTHHAVPNVHESAPNLHDGDPDIDTMPLLAWSPSMARSSHLHGSLSRFFIRHQAYLYFPILLVARMSWLYQSLTHAFQLASAWGDKSAAAAVRPHRLRLAALERFGLLLYYAWTVTMLAAFLSLGQAVAHFLMAQMFCGLLLAIVFGVGHNGMAVYDADDKPDFFRLQVTTTRNVKGSWLVGWFMGGLHYQVEHHLFPTVPRHHLHRLQPLVQGLCQKHGLPYHCTSLWEGTVEIVQSLAKVSREFVREFPAM